ncbi:MAG: glycosyltransferase family 4 protein, partial [Chloroflexi bacterium]|nr:glycosyltransferase family 4 protein [Chloroflexota bacterium]
WHENSPLIVLDALQSHTPVISSDIGGVTDVVKHDVNGLLFPMGNVTALQQLLQRTIDEPQLVDKLRAGVDLPSIDSYAENMMSYLKTPVVVGKS